MTHKANPPGDGVPGGSGITHLGSGAWSTLDQTQAAAPQVVGYVSKTHGSALRVALDAYKGHIFVDVWVFASIRDEDRPAKAGITCKPARSHDLIRLLEEAPRGLA